MTPEEMLETMVEAVNMGCIKTLDLAPKEYVDCRDTYACTTCPATRACMQLSKEDYSIYKANFDILIRPLLPKHSFGSKLMKKKE